jgi:type IV secretory pathway VirB10-like protein
MNKPGRRTQLVAALIGVFILATLAVAAASGSLGGGDEFEMDSAEPATSGQSTGDTKSEEPQVDPAPADPPAGTGGGPGQTPPAAGPPPPAGPDTPVSSDDTSPPSPTAVADPPSAFSGIRNFEQCAAAGYPVMESYPEQCRTPDGRLFVRVID